jgi:hypothetical protein
MPMSTSSSVSSMVIRRIACRELPPMSKKLSVALTSSRSSRVANMSASTVSIRVRGGTRPAVAVRVSGAGSAALSTLPLALSGKVSRAVTCAGIM